MGTISNTASYLRLWALSLANGQLAAVFLENTIMGGLEAHSVTGTFFGVSYHSLIIHFIGMDRIFPLDNIHSRCANVHGCHGMLLAYSTSSLGRVPE